METPHLAAAKKGAADLGAHLAFLDESGFLLIPTVRRTWAPRGRTPVFRHALRRDRLSTLAALSVSPRRQHLGLYVHWQPTNYHAPEVVTCLQALLRHLRGPIVLLWDRASIHQGPVVGRFLAAHPRLQVAYFPAYAPELNPAEFVWTQAKGRLANSAPPDLADLARRLGHATRRLQRSPDLLWACIAMSDLPWAS